MKNMGSADRIIRAVVGIAVLVAAFFAPPLMAGWLHWIALAAGAILIVTALVSVCPAYMPFGIRTCRQ